MTDGVYRYWERPLLIVATALIVAYFPLALIEDGSPSWGWFVGAAFWGAQLVLARRIWRYVQRRASRRRALRSKGVNDVQ